MRYRSGVNRPFITLGALATLAALPIAVEAAPPSRHLSISANPRPVVYGKSTVISGKLTGPHHDNRTVTILADSYPFEGAFLPVGTDATSSAGDYSLTLKPLVNTRYQAQQASTRSSVLGVLVRIRVSLHLSDRTPESGQRVRFSGRACPQHDGATVRLQKLSRRTGRWYTVRKTVLKDIPGSTCSRYSKRVLVPSDGTYRVVVISGDADHANGISKSKHLNAH